MLISGIVGVVAAAAPALPAAPSSTATRLSAAIAAKPRVNGFFLATLEGRVLTWRLAARGIDGKTNARLRLGRSGPVIATLCTACSATERKALHVSAAAAGTLASGRAYLALRPTGGGSPEVRARIVLGVPALEILSLKDGGKIVLPAAISYRITNFGVGTPPLGHIELTATEVGPIPLSVAEQEGVLTIPDVKEWFLVGRRDMTFALATADRVRLPNPEARVTIHDVRIEGRK